MTTSDRDAVGRQELCRMASEPVHLTSLDVQGMDGDARPPGWYSEGCEATECLDATPASQVQLPLF